MRAVILITALSQGLVTKFRQVGCVYLVVHRHVGTNLVDMIRARLHKVNSK